MQGGIALFVLLAVTVLGERANIWEWIGIAAVVLAAAMLGGSLAGGDAQSTLDGGALVETSIAAIVISVWLLAAPPFRGTGAAAAIVSGIAFGMASLYTKPLADAVGNLPKEATLMGAMLANPYSYLLAIANVAGLVILQNAFATERGIIAMPLSTAFSNLVPIAGGVVAFRERLPADPMAAAMRVSAFVLTIAASAALAARDAGVSARQPIVPAVRNDSISPSA
jgi:drug/metabolite transporter (DMT)-like permease